MGKLLLLKVCYNINNMKKKPKNTRLSEQYEIQISKSYIDKLDIYDHGKKAYTMTVNNYINISKTSNNLSTKATEQKKPTTYDVVSACLVYRLARKRGQVILFNEIPILPFGWIMVFNSTFYNISSIVVSFIGGGNRSTRRKHRPAAIH